MKLNCFIYRKLLLFMMTGVGIASVAHAKELTRCNGFNDPGVAWAALIAGTEEAVPLRSLSPAVLLPDGREFKTWEQPAIHHRTFFVAQNHPAASDANPGTEERPWKTMGKAAASLQPGDRVIVKEGIYREWVRPARGGTGPQHMITYQAEDGEEVIISGSDILTGKWSRSKVAGHLPVAKAWMIDLPVSLFDGYNPFAESSLSETMKDNPYNFQLNDSSGNLKSKYAMPRGLVFQNGQRLVQTSHYEELVKSGGTYWVEPGGKRIHLRTIGDVKPSVSSFEITTRPFAFAAEKTGLGFIRVDGFTVRHVANCIPVPQLGAISTMQGHHWIVENNLVSEVNGLGLDFGYRQTFIPYEVPEDTPSLSGVGHIIRRNTFINCGVSSMSGLGLICGLVENNFSSGCGWKMVGELAESGGIKLHYLKHSLVRGNVVRGTVMATGLWIDHSNHNSRITGNVVTGAQGNAFFLEASYGPNLIDHNIFWDCTGIGIQLTCSGNALICHNLVGRCSKEPVRIAGSSTRKIDVETERLSVAIRILVTGNIFYGFEDRFPVIPGGNISDYNLFVNPPGENTTKLEILRRSKGVEMNSETTTATLDLSPEKYVLHQSPLLPEFKSPRIFEITTDFFGTPLPVAITTQAGPFLLQNVKPDIVLCPGWEK